MYDYGRGRELHIQKSLEATKLVTHAGKIPPKVFFDRTLLVEGDYFCVEHLGVVGSRTSASLPGPSLAADGEPAPGLQYLFVAGGAARITGACFAPVELPLGSMAAVPAVSPEFVVEDLGGLNLMRITPRWPRAKR
jgi:mannose-6-phosphate isomerase